MIKSFRHTGIEKFFKTGSKAGIQPAHANKLRVQLKVLDNAKVPADMNFPGWQLHALKGDFAGHFSISVHGKLAAYLRF